jgi:pyruvate,water dikinase
VWRSASSEAALGYRRRMGVSSAVRIGVVIQEMVEADAAGVLFTRNPVTGADEIVVEATWGLGEAIVQGLVQGLAARLLSSTRARASSRAGSAAPTVSMCRR